MLPQGSPSNGTPGPPCGHHPAYPIPSPAAPSTAASPTLMPRGSLPTLAPAGRARGTITLTPPLPSPHPISMHEAAGGSARHRNGAPSPALVAVWALRMGSARPKQGGQAVPLPLKLLEEPGAKGTRAWDKASGTPQLHQVSGTGCCPAKPSAPNPGHPAAALPSLPTLCGAGRTGSVGLAGTGSCQAPGPGSTAEAGAVPPGWLRVARLRRHAPTMGTPGSTHSSGTR